MSFLFFLLSQEAVVCFSDFVARWLWLCGVLWCVVLKVVGGRRKHHTSWEDGSEMVEVRKTTTQQSNTIHNPHPTSLHINYTHARLNYYVSVCVRVLVCYVCAMCAYVMCVWHVLMYEICACVYVSVFFVLMCVCVCVCILARRLACNNWGDGCDVHVV